MLPRQKCSECSEYLEAKAFCSSCKGAGGWGDWDETGDDVCGHCDGTGDPSPDDIPVHLRHCPKCFLIFPPTR